MHAVNVYPGATPPGRILVFSVILARMDGKWLLCRHRERDTWELPGGHIEMGETPEQCAVRELYEETGAQGSMIRLGDYGVTRDGGERCGALFLCDVETLAPLPVHSEMAERRLFSALPDALTYPDIQPHLYRYAQGYLNTITAPDEVWDVLDADKKPAGRTHRRGDPMQAGDYHLVVDVWMRRKDGRFLLTRRAPTKGYPLMWESTGGSASAGEDSLTAALREAQEEAGMALNAVKGRLIHTYRGRDHFKDVWLFDHECELADVVLQEGETVDCRLADKQEILALYASGELVPYPYMDLFAALMP